MIEYSIWKWRKSDFSMVKTFNWTVQTAIKTWDVGCKKN